MVHGQVGQNLAVNFDVAFLQQTNQLGIRKPFQTGGCIDTLNPKGAKISLFCFPVTVSILLPLFPGIFGNSPNIFTGAEITSGFQ